MKILTQILLIFSLCLVGELISFFLPFAFPSSIISMLLLLILILVKWINPNQIKEVSEFLLNNMAFFFIPAGVAIIERYEMIRGNILTLLLITIITTAVTFLATVYTVIGMMKLMKKGKHHD